MFGIIEKVFPYKMHMLNIKAVSLTDQKILPFQKFIKSRSKVNVKVTGHTNGKALSQGTHMPNIKALSLKM